jgi:hypothetical protein
MRSATQTVHAANHFSVRQFFGSLFRLTKPTYKARSLAEAGRDYVKLSDAESQLVVNAMKGGVQHRQRHSARRNAEASA